MLSIRIFGTRFGVGLPFLLLLALYGLLGLVSEAVIAFLSVAAHEVAHVLVACAYDLEVESVELAPFGGVAQVNGLLEQDPYIETSVALAGPASSFMLAGIGALLWRTALSPGRGPGDFVLFNLVLGVVNLFPVLPLDGGRVARAFLQRQLGYRQATSLMCRAGRVASVLLVLSGVALTVNGMFFPNTFVFAVFLYLFSLVEQRRSAVNFFSFLTRRRERLARQSMLSIHQFTALSSVSLMAAAKRFSPRRYSVITVLDSGYRQIGTLTETEIIEAILAGNGHQTLGEMLKRHGP